MTTMPSDPRILPGWFIKTVCGAISVIFAGAVPWAWHVSSTLTELQIRMEHASEVMNDLPLLERRMIDHIAEPKLHHAGFGKLQGQVDSLEKRLERIEATRP